MIPDSENNRVVHAPQKSAHIPSAVAAFLVPFCLFAFITLIVKSNDYQNGFGQGVSEKGRLHRSIWQLSSKENWDIAFDCVSIGSITGLMGIGVEQTCLMLIFLCQKMLTKQQNQSVIPNSENSQGFAFAPKKPAYIPSAVIAFLLPFCLFALMAWIDRSDDYEKGYWQEMNEKGVNNAHGWEPSSDECIDIALWCALCGFTGGFIVLGIERTCVMLIPWWQEPLLKRQKQDHQ